MHLRARLSKISFAVLTLLALASAVSADTVIVQMTTVDFQPTYVPADLTVRPGDTVRWVNVDPFLLDHSTSSGTGSADPLAGALWSSGTIRTGEYFEHTFADAGDFAYFSVSHEYEGMFGMIHVSTSLPVPSIEPTTWGRVKSTFRDLIPRD
jgi:plastocyanin